MFLLSIIIMCYLNCTVSNVSLFTFLKANIHTLPRYLSEPPYHLLYIVEDEKNIGFVNENESESERESKKQ